MLKKLAFVMVVALFAVWNAAAQDARVTQVSGTVEVRNAGERNWRAASAGTVIGRNTTISTGIRSRALIQFGSSTLTVEPVTVLTFEELSRRSNSEQAAMHLTTGRVRADVNPPSGVRTNFTVTSPSATASVRGTSFTFDGRRVTTHSGRVALSNSKGQTVIVNRNQSSHTDSSRQERLTLPIETIVADLRPSLPELDNTGSGKQSSAGAELINVIVSPDWD